jgi:glycerol uptake facilitator-like aquaporin
VKPTLARRVVAEALGTAFLLAAVVGSGIMAERLAQGNTALALLANTAATGAALVALIIAFGLLSGAHFNPVVTLASAMRGGLSWRDVPFYILAQVAGALAGTNCANKMFGLPALFLSQHQRSGPGQVFSEFVATFGLLSIILATSRLQVAVVAVAVAAYICAAYWFTASTSFANPAVTMARSFTDTFTGIRLSDVPAFVLAQLVAAFAASFLFSWLLPAENKVGGSN